MVVIPRTLSRSFRGTFPDAGPCHYLYPGDQHYFADSSLPSYDPDATALLTQRVLDFLRTR